MADESVTIAYDPFTLPTAQHRAGLAGLCVQIETMRRRDIAPLPSVSRAEDGSLRVELTAQTLTTLFNELYGSTWREERRSSKPKQKLIRNLRVVEEQKPGPGPRGKKQQWYEFEAPVPKGAFLTALLMPDPWLQLWRDAVWSVLRERDRKRIPYKERLEGKDVSLAKKVFQSLLKEGSRAPLSSSLLVGVEDKNAERVDFAGFARDNFVLHFWPVVSGVYVPEVIDRKGKPQYKGYVFAVPDVVDIEGFVGDFAAAVASLGTRAGRLGRPRDAVISVPQEGALDYLRHVLDLAKARSQRSEIAFNVSGVEVYHLHKRGNTVHMLASDRIPIDREVLSDYELVRDRYRHALFRRQLIRNILDRKPWPSGFDQVFSANPHEFFVGAKAPFASDAQRRFRVDFEERRATHE